MMAGFEDGNRQFKKVAYKVVSNSSTSYSVELSLEDPTCCTNSSQSVYCSRYS